MRGVMRRVIIESPYAGTDEEIEENLAYLRAAMRDCLLQGEAPFASHALYTQPGVLDDRNDTERNIGITAGYLWRPCAATTVVYTDLGFSYGMQSAIARANSEGHPVEYRQLGGRWARIGNARLEAQLPRLLPVEGE